MQIPVLVTPIDGNRFQARAGEHDHPWMEFAGTLRDDELFAQWQQAIAERRLEIDADPDAP